ncbi:uncharacterized protein EDB91DRAFT_1127285 [Suillus paluster]|uniref:uncharacterized protein n=1 Tax=Suillus paluster TaxID=48578 RepID=UPI001B868A8B|nr:uncharacterized protein EDB91DRAFT_1127285 [Suillus paluster]KAG1742650.1 hypothetical protein EDB91DRAFT_1127285 [Suillus paluster]
MSGIRYFCILLTTPIPPCLTIPVLALIKYRPQNLLRRYFRPMMLDNQFRWLHRFRLPLLPCRKALVPNRLTMNLGIPAMLRKA